jgi:preprotein translocase subunit SecG
MTTVLIVIHLMVVLAMIGLVLLQRSEGGALGIGGGQGAFMSGRSAGNVLTRTTGILAAAFFATSIGLAILARIGAGPSDIFDTLPGQNAPAAETPARPAAPIAAPESAADVFEQLGGDEAGPQTPPADAAPPSDATAPATEAAPPTGTQEPAPAEQPAAPAQ